MAGNRDRYRSAAAVGWGLIAVCVIGWERAFLAFHWVGWDPWFYAWRSLGTDFVHNFLAVHLVSVGANPYRQDFGDYRGLYAYPPIVIGLFYWCVLFPAQMGREAVIVWTVFVAGMVTTATLAARAARRRLGLTDVPRPLVVGLVMVCTPVVFAMERGNCDALVLILLVAAAMLMRRRSWRGDALAGVCLAVAMWIKIYPGLVLLSAVALRRWRVVGWGVAIGLMIPVVLWGPTKDFFWAARSSEGYRVSFLESAAHLGQDPKRASSGVMLSYPALEASSHSLTTYWRTFWEGVGEKGIAQVPGLIGAGVVLGPMLLVVGWKVWRCPHPNPPPEYKGRGQEGHEGAMALVYLMWVAMLATFWMPVSYDYNLIFLPVLAAAVWDFSDPWFVHALILPAAIYWQPFTLSWVPMQLLLLIKLMALGGLGICVYRRAGRSGLHKMADFVDVA